MHACVPGMRGPSFGRVFSCMHPRRIFDVLFSFASRREKSGRKQQERTGRRPRPRRSKGPSMAPPPTDQGAGRPWRSSARAIVCVDWQTQSSIFGMGGGGSSASEHVPSLLAPRTAPSCVPARLRRGLLPVGTVVLACPGRVPPSRRLVWTCSATPRPAQARERGALPAPVRRGRRGPMHVHRDATRRPLRLP